MVVAVTLLVISLLSPYGAHAAAVDLSTGSDAALYSSSENVFDFIGGFLFGLQADPSHPSICIQSFNSVVPSWQAVIEAAQYMWDSGQLDNLFVVLYAFDTFLAEVVSTMQKCDVAIFSDKLKSLGTVEGFFKAMYTLGINIQSMGVSDIQDDFWNTFNDLINGYYTSAGIDLGQFVSALISFYL